MRTLAVVLLCMASFALPGSADPGNARLSALDAGKAIARGIIFIQDDAVKWKAEKKCASCHHGTMTLFALNEAKRQRYAVDSAILADMGPWVKERLAGIEKPRDTRAGFSMINTMALYFSLMSRNQSELHSLSTIEQQQIADHAARHLESDGSVLTPATMDPPLAKNGPPPVFESREVLTLLAMLAMGSSNADSAKKGCAKSASWLSTVKPGDDAQAANLRLELALQELKPTRPHIDRILKRQNPDGGWGQIPGAVSDAFATGHTLYALSLAGVKRDKPQIQRGVAFLIANQNPDGSWPMVSRAHPGVTPMTNPVPITYFGSAWGLIGLVRSAPPPPPPSSPAAIQGAVDKSLAFLREDAIAWRKKSECATCHHGALTALTFAEAKHRGLRLEESSFKDMLNWSKARFVPAYEETPKLKDGFEIPSLAMPILTLTRWTSPDAITAEESDKIAKYILDRQQPDGGWIGPKVNGPPVFESREIMAIWFYFALEPAAAGSGERASAYRTAREKALAFLRSIPVGDSSQAVALRLLLDIRDRNPARKLRAQVTALFELQNPDGGWSQVKDLPSDAYATGQALYVLSLAGRKSNSPEMQRGAA